MAGIDKRWWAGEPQNMVVVKAPGRLLAAGASLFLLVPLAVVTAGIFSRQVWWDLPVRELALAGWVALAVVAPLSWRLIMGRRGALQSTVAVLALACAYLGVHSLVVRGTLQGVWSLTVMTLCLGLVEWIRTELSRPYFDPKMDWFSGLPRPLAQVRAVMDVRAADGGMFRPALQVARIGLEGAFVFSAEGLGPAGQALELEFRFRDRNVRLEGDVVRQFFHPGAGWGAGVRFRSSRPDVGVEFGEFLNAIRSEGHAV